MTSNNKNDNKDEDQTSPSKFVKPADLFKMRRRTSNNFAAFNTNSNSLTPIDNKSREAPSPLASKFVTPIKPSTSSVSIQASPLKYDNRNLLAQQRTPTKIFSLPPTFHIEPQSPLKCLNNISDPSPTKNLPVLLKNPFNQPVKRKLQLGSASPRKQKSPNKKTRMLEIDEDANLEPPQMKQQLAKNIKLEIYQHPYLSWLTLFPRSGPTGNSKDNKKAFPLVDPAAAGEMMHKDWCDSLDDLTNLLTKGKCTHFYLCTDNYTVLFKTIPSSNSKKPFVQAFISPFNCGMGCKLNKLSIEFKCPEASKSNSSTSIISIAQENSHASFGSSSTQSKINFEDGNASQPSRQGNSSKVTTSIDSGNVSDSDEDDFGEDENEDASQFLESIGVSLPSLQAPKKGFVESDSNTQTISTSSKHLAMIEGQDNIDKLVKFFQTNRLYTINKVGKFAFIPPTLISPCAFKLGTKRMIASKDLDQFPIKSIWPSST